jgi:hypothetical protein
MRIFILAFFLCSCNLTFAQGLLDELDEIAPTDQETDYTTATFKTSRIVNGQSIENIAQNNLLFVIAHRFGPVSNGIYDLFGLDQASMRMGLEYGLTSWLTVSVGRSTFQKTYDGFVKAKLLRQSTGKVNMPVSVSYFGSTAINSLRWTNPDRINYFTSRLSYAHQLLIARKFNSSISLQLSPTVIHKNLVPTTDDQNTSYAMGVGGRFKLTQRVSFNSEYFYLLPGKTADDNHDSFSLGFDIETGGHVFQLHVTNSLGMFERAFVTETQGSWQNGQILFGFNLTRTFNFNK